MSEFTKANVYAEPKIISSLPSQIADIYDDYAKHFIYDTEPYSKDAKV